MAETIPPINDPLLAGFASSIPEFASPADDADPDGLSTHERRFADGKTERDLRQQTRLPIGPAVPFNPRLAYELALEMHANALDVFLKYGYTADDAARLLHYAPFTQTLRRYRDEIVASGVSFKMKAKVQAEDLLTHSYDLATDPETPASVRADLIKWTAAVAGLGPDPKKGEGGGAGGSEFTLNITFPTLGPAQAPAIDVTPTMKEIST